MNRLTTYIGESAHGLPGKTEVQALKSRYAIRGNFECTAIIDRLAAYEDNTQTPKEQADMINNYKQMSQALKKQKEQNVQMRKMLDRLKKRLVLLAVCSLIEFCRVILKLL